MLTVHWANQADQHISDLGISDLDISRHLSIFQDESQTLRFY
jgi:hypothetical protein